jgi:large subunit ribosomal protein L37Ae
MAEDKARSTGSAGRFGARYGRVARRRVKEIEGDMHNATLDGELFTGGAYRPETPGGRTVRRSIRAALSTDDE